jgi:uncharacterized membrane protein
MKAEEKLRTIAEASKVSMREIYSLVNQVYIDDENLQKRFATAKNAEIAVKQMKLMEVQTHNETMKELLLERKLSRTIWRTKKWEQLTKIFKKNGRTEGV